MKIEQMAAFQKHLKGSAPDHFVGSYLIALEDGVERRALVRKIAQFLRHYRPALEIVSYSKESHSFQQLLQEMEEVSLFASEKLVIYEGAEALSKEQVELFGRALKSLSEKTQIILAIEKANAPLARLMEKEGVVLDLLREKPWDRKKRIQESLFFHLRSKGKKISANHLEMLIERIGLNQQLLENECDKLICYIGDREEITAKDIEILSPKTADVGSWQIARALIWQEKSPTKMVIEDLSQWLMMLGALRYQLYVGLAVCQAEREKKAVSFGNLSPKQLSLYQTKCQSLSEGYFSRLLGALYKLEKRAKESYIKAGRLWDLTEIAIAKEYFLEKVLEPV